MNTMGFGTSSSGFDGLMQSQQGLLLDPNLPPGLKRIGAPPKGFGFGMGFGAAMPVGGGMMPAAPGGDDGGGNSYTYNNYGGGGGNDGGENGGLPPPKKIHGFSFKTGVKHMMGTAASGASSMEEHHWDQVKDDNDFGGLRAAGGPVEKGKAYVVGEQGPEVIVPKEDGTVIPNHALVPLPAPVTPIPSSPVGQAPMEFLPPPQRGMMPPSVPQPGDDELMRQIKMRGAPMGSRVPATAMVGLPPVPVNGAAVNGRPVPVLPPMPAPAGQQQQVPMEFLPPMPPVPMQAPLTPAGAFMPVPLTGAAPGMMQMPLGVNGSRIAQSPSNHSYGVNTGTGSSVGMDGGLAGRPVRQMGRSANDPMRIAEQMRRQGDPRAIMHFGEMQMQQQFANGQNDKNFAQQVAYSQMQQQAQQALQQQARQDRFDIWAADQAAAQAARDEHWRQQLTVIGLNQGYDALEAERKRQQELEDRNRLPNVGFTAIPNSDYGIPTADGRPMGTVPVKKPNVTAPAGLVPQSANINGVKYGPDVKKPVKPQIEMVDVGEGKRVPYQVIVDAEGKVTMRRVKMIDEDGDGLDDRAEGGGGEQAAGSAYEAKVKSLMGGM